MGPCFLEALPPCLRLCAGRRQCPPWRMVHNWTTTGPWEGGPVGGPVEAGAVLPYCHRLLPPPPPQPSWHHKSIMNARSPDIENVKERYYLDEEEKTSELWYSQNCTKFCFKPQFSPCLIAVLIYQDNIAFTASATLTRGGKQGFLFYKF